VDSRTIGDGERHERSKFVATGRKGRSDENRLVFFVLFYCSRQPVCFEVGKNPDHGKATTLSEKLVECGKRKEAE